MKFLKIFKGVESLAIGVTSPALFTETHFVLGKEESNQWQSTVSNTYTKHEAKRPEKPPMNLHASVNTIPTDREKLKDINTTSRSTFQSYNPKVVCFCFVFFWKFLGIIY